MKVPPTFELRSLNSKSRVLTINYTMASDSRCLLVITVLDFSLPIKSKLLKETRLLLCCFLCFGTTARFRLPLKLRAHTLFAKHLTVTISTSSNLYQLKINMQDLLELQH